MKELNDLIRASNDVLDYLRDLEQLRDEDNDLKTAIKAFDDAINAAEDRVAFKNAAEECLSEHAETLQALADNRPSAS